MKGMNIYIEGHFCFKSSIDESYTDIFLTTYGILYVKGGVAKKSLAYVLFLSIYSQKFLNAPFLIPHKLWGVDNRTEKIQ